MLFVHVRETLVSYPDPAQLSVACSTGWGLGSGSFRAARLPGQATRAACAESLWVEKNPVPFPNRRDAFAVRQLCPIVPQDNIVVSNKHN